VPAKFFRILTGAIVCLSLSACESMMTTTTPYGKFDAKPVDNRNHDLSLKGRHFSLGEVDSPPVPVSMPKPGYPYEILQLEGEGAVRFVMVVNDRGNVSQYHVVYADDQRFAEAILKVLPKWRFKPATKDGKNVSAWGIMTYTFRIRDDDSFPRVVFSSPD
jgi:TonB family protein